MNKINVQLQKGSSMHNIDNIFIVTNVNNGFIYFPFTCVSFLPFPLSDTVSISRYDGPFRLVVKRQKL